MKPLTPEKAIEHYTELQRRVNVGAYVELQHDGSFPEDDGSPESTTLESLHNLEEWAAKQDLEFCFEVSNGTWVLLPMSKETRAARGQAQEEPPDLVAEQLHRIESPSYNELEEDEPLYHFPEEDEDDEYIGEVGDEEGDGSGLHQCPYCYNLVNEEHIEFCPLNPNRNREIVP